MPFLPVDTAVVVEVGPLVDDTDFKSLEVAIAYDAAGMSVDLFENTGSAVTKTDLALTTAGVNDWTHKGNGVYEVEITAAQNNTEGTLRVVGVCDGVLPFESPVYTVVPVMVYDSLVLGTDTLETDLTQIGGVVQSAIDGAKGLIAVLQEMYAVVVNKAVVTGADPKAVAYRNNADDADVVTHSIPEANTGRTKS